MIRIGIVGTGGMAHERTHAFHEMKQTSVQSVCSRDIKNTQELCNLTGAKGFSDYAQAISGVDAMVICVPNNIHYEFTLKALQMGKHVLVEYPLCVNQNELASLIEAASSSDSVLMVGNTIIHEAMFAYLANHKEKLGRIISASSRVAWYSDDLPNKWYLNRRYSGEVFSAFHYHHIEYYRHLLGEVETVFACDESISNEEAPEYNDAAGGTLILKHTNGGTSCIQWYLSASGAGIPRGLWINGTKSSVTIVSVNSEESKIIWDEGGECKTEILKDSWGIRESCDDFIQGIHGALDHKARLTSDIMTLKIGFKANESAVNQTLLSVK